MAMVSSSTDATSAANWTQDYIYRDLLVPLAYAVPQVNILEKKPLPEKGNVIQINRLVEQSEAASLSELTTIAENDTDGLRELQFGKASWTIGKRGAFHNITDLADYVSLGDLADASSRAMQSVMARSLNSRYYDATADHVGFRWMRQDNDATAWKRGLLVDSSTTTTVVCDELTEADDFWNNAQITFTSGKLAGLSFEVTDWANATNTLTVSIPEAAAANDTFDICSVGASASTVSPLTSSDTVTLAQIYYASAIARQYGAGSFGPGGARVEFDLAGIKQDIDPTIASGVIFTHPIIANDLRATLAGSDASAVQGFWQSDAGFARMSSGAVQRIGGLLVCETNHHKRIDVAGTAALSNTSGVGWPVQIVYRGCAFVTTLRDNKGNRQGLVTRSKVPSANDMAILYDSVKMRNESYFYNVMGTHNALWACTLWVGTQNG